MSTEQRRRVQTSGGTARFASGRPGTQHKFLQSQAAGQGDLHQHSFHGLIQCLVARRTTMESRYKPHSFNHTYADIPTQQPSPRFSPPFTIIVETTSNRYRQHSDTTHVEPSKQYVLLTNNDHRCNIIQYKYYCNTVVTETIQ